MLVDAPVNIRGGMNLVQQNFPIRSQAIVITGPTGVGKTDLALSLAQSLPIEIINADVGQFYEPLTIGTAKPDWRHLPCRHHLFDIIDHPRDLSVLEYRERVRLCISAIRERGNIPLIVGGSLFYLKSLIYPPRAQQSGSVAGENERQVAEPQTPSPQETAQSVVNLWNELYALDPVRAQAINKNDHYRITRALAIWRQTGRKPSECVPVYDPLFDFFLMYVSREKKQLHERIAQRVDAMLHGGWIEEVRCLKDSAWEPFLLRKKIIGYPDILQYLNSSVSNHGSTSLSENITRKTLSYAKRQETFWRSFERTLAHARAGHAHESFHTHCNLTLSHDDLYINQLLSDIKFWLQKNNHVTRKE